MTEKRIKLSDEKTIMKTFKLKNKDQLRGFKVGMMCFLSMETFRHADDIDNLDRDLMTLLKDHNIPLPTIETVKGLFVEVD